MIIGSWNNPTTPPEHSGLYQLQGGVGSVYWSYFTGTEWRGFLPVRSTSTKRLDVILSEPVIHGHLYKWRGLIHGKDMLTPRQQAENARARVSKKPRRAGERKVVSRLERVARLPTSPWKPRRV